MTRGEEQARTSVWQSAWKCLKNNVDGIAAVAAVTVALRIAVLIPVLLCADFGGGLPAWLGYALAALVYIFGVIPMRFWGREKMRRMVYSRHLNHHRKHVYKKWLITGLLRNARGILWGLPFLAGTVYFTVFRARLDVKTFWTPIQNLAVLVGQEPNIGTGFTIALILMAVSGLLFVCGWWRDLPFEYLPVRSLGPKKTLHWSRRILKKYRKEMRQNTFVNFFLALPAWIGLGAVLVPYALAGVDFSLNPELVLSQILRLLRTSLPDSVLLMLGGVALLLYVPFWALRKARNTALMGALMKESAHGFHSSHSSHSSGQESAEDAEDAENVLPEEPQAEEEAPQTEPEPAPMPVSTPARNGQDDAWRKEAARRAQEAAQKAQEAAEQAARLAYDAARMAREVVESKQDEP